IRWKLVGNAVTVPAANWIGKRMLEPGTLLDFAIAPMLGTHWPSAAWNVGNGRCRVSASEWPVRHRYKSLAAFLIRDPKPLSLKAVRGFLERTDRSSLNFPQGFIAALRNHERRMQEIEDPTRRPAPARPRTRPFGLQA